MAWNWDFFHERLYGLEMTPTYWELFLDSWGMTIKIAAVSWIIALVIGAFIGVFRTLPDDKLSYRLLRLLGTCWVDLFRNIPILVQMFLWLYVLPVLFPILVPLKKDAPFLLVVLALGLFTSSRVAEQVRAGIQAIPQGMRSAGKALGLKTRQIYMSILLPITLRTIMPPLTSESMNIVKNSTVAIAVPAVYELMHFTQEVTGLFEDINMQIFLVVTVAFALSSIGFSLIMKFIERRLLIPGVGNATNAGRA